MSDSGLNEEQLDGENYSFKVGERLRLVRRQKRMSLQEVEAESCLLYTSPSPRD